MSRICLTFILVFLVIPGMALPDINQNVEVNIQPQSQTQISYGSSSSSSLNLSTTSITQRPFPVGAQPQFPGFSPVYGGPWKEGWNIITTELYKLFETFWPVREAKEAQKGGGKIKSLYWEIPYRGSLLPPSSGVNVLFQINKDTTLPPSAVPIGVVIVKGDEKTVLWQLIARAVLEASKRGASYLNIEQYNYNPCIKSSSFGLGLASTGAGINVAGDLSMVSGGGTGWASAKAGPNTEPFIHAVAYTTESTIKVAIEELKREEIKEEERMVSIAPTPPPQPKIELKKEKRLEAFQMMARVEPDQEKKVIYVRLKNITKERVYVSPIYFKLKTVDGIIHSMNLDTYTTTSRFRAKRIEPGEEISGFLIFTIDKSPQELIYDDMSERAPCYYTFN